MALIRCPECGHENVSDHASHCPQCGYTISAYYLKKKLKRIALGVIILAVAIFSISQFSTFEPLAKSTISKYDRKKDNSYHLSNV